MFRISHSRFNFHPAINISYGLLILFLVLVYLCSHLFDVPTYNLIADPTEVANLPSYTGIISSIGVLFWAAAVSVCFFASVVLRNSSGLVERPLKKKWVNFFLFSSIFSLQLLLDDLFQLHENISILLGNLLGLSKTSKYLHTLEVVVFLVYFGLLIAYVKAFQQLIFRETNLGMLAASIGFFIMSIVLDVGDAWLGEYTLVEDGFKLLGIFSWMIFLAEAAYYRIKLLSLSESREKDC